VEVHVTDLVEWLETAIGERERLARNVADTADSWWVTRRSVSQDLDPVVTALHDSARTELARRFNPDAVLRRCAADRKILDLFDPRFSDSDPWHDILRLMAEGYGYQEATVNG
jgi:hypothetical protein